MIVYRIFFLLSALFVVAPARAEKHSPMAAQLLNQGRGSLAPRDYLAACSKLHAFQSVDTQSHHTACPAHREQLAVAWQLWRDALDFSGQEGGKLLRTNQVLWGLKGTAFGGVALVLVESTSIDDEQRIGLALSLSAVGLVHRRRF
jgi:hypothetical protein